MDLSNFDISNGPCRISNKYLLEHRRFPNYFQSIILLKIKGFVKQTTRIFRLFASFRLLLGRLNTVNPPSFRISLIKQSILIILNGFIKGGNGTAPFKTAFLPLSPLPAEPNITYFIKKTPCLKKNAHAHSAASPSTKSKT